MNLTDVLSTLQAPVSPATFPGQREVKFPHSARNLRSPAPAAREDRGGPRTPPSGLRRGLQAGPPRLPARRTPTATQPVPLSGCTRPNPRTKTTKWLPAASSRDPFVPFGLPNSAGPGYKWPGSAGGLRGGPAGPRRPGVEAGGGGVKARPATESRRRREDGGHFVWVCCSAAAAGSRGSGAWRWVGQGS